MQRAAARTLTTWSPRQIARNGTSSSIAAESRASSQCVAHRRAARRCADARSCPYSAGSTSRPPVTISPSRPASTACAASSSTGCGGSSTAMPPASVTASKYDLAAGTRRDVPHARSSPAAGRCEADERRFVTRLRRSLRPRVSESFKASHPLPVRHRGVVGRELDPRIVEVVVDHLVAERRRGRPTTARTARAASRSVDGTRGRRRTTYALPVSIGSSSSSFSMPWRPPAMIAATARYGLTSPPGTRFSTRSDCPWPTTPQRARAVVDPPGDRRSARSCPRRSACTS